MEFAALPIHAGQRCALQAYFPARRDLRDKLLTIERDDGIASDPAIRFIPLSPTPANLGNVTWNTRPSESRLIDTPLTLTAAFGHNQSTVAFPCPSSAPLRLQAMCVGSGCRLEYDTSPALVNVEPLLGACPSTSSASTGLSQSSRHTLSCCMMHVEAIIKMNCKNACSRCGGSIHPPGITR